MSRGPLDGFSVWKKLDGNDETKRVTLETYYKAMIASTLSGRKRKIGV